MLVKNAMDEEQVKTGKLKEGFSRDRELRDLRCILDTPGGRRFLWRYINICRVFESSFTPSASIYFNEGQRDIGLKLMNDIMEADEEALVRIMKEAKEAERKERPQVEE